jgi:hypothetical protein
MATLMFACEKRKLLRIFACEKWKLLRIFACEKWKLCISREQ